MIINSVLRVQQSLRQAYIEMIYKVHTDSSPRIGTGDPNSAQGKGLGRMSVGVRTGQVPRQQLSEPAGKYN